MEVTNDFIKSFAQHVTLVETEPKTAQETLNEIQPKLNHLLERQKSLFKFENPKPIETEIEGLRHQILMNKAIVLGYNEILDLSAFLLRTEDGWPIFMILDAEREDQRFSITVHGFDNHIWEPYSIPKQIKVQMADVTKKLEKSLEGFFRSKSSVRLSAELAGYVPDNIRPLIKKAIEGEAGEKKPRFFNKIFIVAEAPKWELDRVPRAKADPIVVGWRSDVQKMFVIATYDPTSFEKYVYEQFAYSVVTEK